MTDITVVTHSGNFHADDVFSIAALKSVYESFNLVRTRDAALIKQADIVVDVGGEYDAGNGRFDHHQRGGAGERENGIPYSSFGLVWKKYGLQLCQGDQYVANKVDAKLVSQIDAIDCGFVEGITAGINKGITLSQTIGMFNPTWQETTDVNECFDEAVEYAVKVLSRFIASAQGGSSARALVAKAINTAEDSRLIVLKQYAPWKSTVNALSEKALYVVYPSHSGQWTIQTVPLEPGSFEDRQPLPAHWAGLSDEEFQAVVGLDDAVFCHNGLFIAGAKSFESIMKLAEMALDQ